MKLLRTASWLLTSVALLMASAGWARGATLTIAVQAGAPEPAVYKELSKEFTRQTGIAIEWVDIPQEQQYSKLLIELMSGSGTYDVIALDHPWVASFAEAGYLEPLDELIASDRADFLEGALKAMSYKGKLYGVPQYAVVVVMYYRTDLFRKYGLREPTLDRPLTWDEFLSHAKALTLDTNGDGKPDIYGTIVEGKRHPVPVAAFMDWMYQAGGQVVADDGTVLVNQKPAVEALQFLVDLVHKYKVAPPGAASFDHVDNHTMFLQGSLGMAVNWQYAYSLMKDPSQSKVVNNFAVALPPKKVVSTSMSGAWGLAIPKASRNKEAAAQWIRFITSTEQLYRLRSRVFGPPVRRSELPLLTRDPSLSKEDLRALEVMTKALEQGSVFPRIPEWPQVQDRLAEAISDAISLRSTPQAALDAAARDISRMLKR